MLRISSFILFAMINNACSTLATGGAEATGLALLHDRRTSEIMLKDERIEINAGLELNAHDDIRSLAHINVTSYNGKVLLSGEAPNKAVHHKIVEIVRVISGVKMVHDEIVIAEPSSLAQRSQDTLITTRVKSALSEIRNLPGFDATRVKVVTERRVVYLMGLLHPNEGNVAAEMARRVDDVEKVVKIFEYIPQ